MMGRTGFLAQDRINERLRGGKQERLAQAASYSMQTQTSWKHSLDIASRLANRLATHGIDQLTREADRLFRENCSDALLAEYMLGLPLGGLPEIRAALSARGAQGGPEKLADVVRTAIARDWRQLSPLQVEDATDLYLCSLGWARSQRRRALLAPVTLRNASSYAC